MPSGTFRGGLDTNRGQQFSVHVMTYQLLKPEEVRQLLNVSRSWLYDAANDGRIPCIRLGGAGGPLRFERATLERWIADSRNSPTPQPR
jgi:excisionase family DNA binding protein